MCTFMLVCAYSEGSGAGRKRLTGPLTAVCFLNLCACHTGLKAGHSKEKRTK